jgi:hypothetical protein
MCRSGYVREQEGAEMKFMAIIKSDADTEAGTMPDATFFAEMDVFNKKMMDAGVMVGGEGLHPSSAGARLDFDSSGIKVTPGPFPNANELVAGFWLMECPSLDDAIGWMKQCPLAAGTNMQIEIRQVFTNEEFEEQVSSLNSN